MSELALREKPKKKIKIGISRFWAGATCEQVLDILLPPGMLDFYEFEFGESPDILLYGPYHGPMPKGQYKRVFIGCENIRPIMSECDWAFGVQHEDTIEDSRYMRFRRWGDSPQFNQSNKNWAAVAKSKKKFCVFLYSQRNYFREAFFRALSKYKRIDAPGRSMNNMDPIDSGPGADRNWKTKIDFIRDYKFVIAFENSAFPGYNTEKLTHAIEADSLPIYWGDWQIERCFNVRRFINAYDYLPRLWPNFPRVPSHPHSIRSSGPISFSSRVSRRLNSMLTELEQRIWASRGFGPLIDEIIRIDSDDQLYLEYLKQPFLVDNKLSEQSTWMSRWRSIFDGV
jgi:alpha(1,3/1,4) fucosyltransferase